MGTIIIKNLSTVTDEVAMNMVKLWRAKIFCVFDIDKNIHGVRVRIDEDPSSGIDTYTFTDREEGKK